MRSIGGGRDRYNFRKNKKVQKNHNKKLDKYNCFVYSTIKLIVTAVNYELI